MYIIKQYRRISHYIDLRRMLGLGLLIKSILGSQKTILTIFGHARYWYLVIHFFHQDWNHLTQHDIDWILPSRICTKKWKISINIWRKAKKLRRKRILAHPPTLINTCCRGTKFLSNNFLIMVDLFKQVRLKSVSKADSPFLTGYTLYHTHLLYRVFRLDRTSFIPQVQQTKFDSCSTVCLFQNIAETVIQACKVFIFEKFQFQN